MSRATVRFGPVQDEVTLMADFTTGGLHRPLAPAPRTSSFLLDPARLDWVACDGLPGPPGTSGLRGVSWSWCSQGVTRGGRVDCGCAGLSFVLVAGGGGTVGVQHDGPVHLVDHYLVVEQNRIQSRTLVLPPSALWVRWCTSHAAAGWSQPTGRLTAGGAGSLPARPDPRPGRPLCR